MKTKFIYQDEKSHKFWDIEITGNKLTVTFGKAGTQGQAQTKEFASDAECNKAAEKLIAEKTKKGYTAVSEDSTPEATGFTPPLHLYDDLLELAVYLEANHPEELERTAVSGENIEEMEAAAGFTMPEAFVDFWEEKGSLFFSKDEFIYALYAYNAEGPNGNNLYGFLTFYQQFYRTKFALVEEEKTFFTHCCWVLGMIILGKQMRIFVSDPLGTVRYFQFDKALRDIDDETFNHALLPVLEAKIALRSFMSSDTYKALAQTNTAAYDTDEEDSDDDNNSEAAETQAFLDKHNIKRLSYQEVLSKLKTDQLFDYWDDEDGNNRYVDDYESEHAYFEEFDNIYYCEGDLHIAGDLEIPHVYVSLLVVHGNMTIEGKVSSGYAGPTPYYVTGNSTIDYLHLGYFQKTAGLETVRYVASAWGQDDEMIHSMPFRKINAPYFFSWFYDLACFEFATDTVITALYNYEDLLSYKTDNAFLPWHDYAAAFHPDLCYSLSDSDHDMLNMSITGVYEALKNKTAVLREGVTAEGIKLTRQGIQLKKEGDTSGAYQLFDQACTKSPGFYPAYYEAGMCLFQEKAYAQAKEIFAKGIPLTPEKLAYERGCIQQAAICAMQLHQYEQAEEWSEMAIQKGPSAYVAMRILAEALIYQQKYDEAKDWLEKSIDIRSIFSNNWLLGLIYHLQGDQKKADKFYQEAVQRNANAQPYTQQTTLHYIYGTPVTVDWDTKPAAPKTKDQTYWDQFFAEMLNKYGPDMYKKTGKFPSDWLNAKLSAIPEQYRTQEMLQALMEHQTGGEYDVAGATIGYFNHALYTEEIILLAVNREEPCFYQYIPKAFITKQVYETHRSGIDLAYVPKEDLTYDLCFLAVTQNQYNYKHVPEAFRDERMNIALIAGGNLGQFHCKDLSKIYYTNEYIKAAIDLGIHVIKNIPVKLVDKEIYEYATAKYGQDPEWPFIVEQYDRQRWRFGSRSYIDSMGRNVRKYGIDIFDHVDLDRVNLHSFSYYQKHLGHLPAFREKVASYGWTERSKISEEYIAEPEFDYDIFDKVWACFWDEDFIIKAITFNKDGANERIYDVPRQYLTQKICDIAVSKTSYDFQFVPKHLVTPEMCLKACSADYGVALEYVPLPMRTLQVCQAAVSQDADNIKFVPLEFRTPEFCANIIVRKNGLSRYVPHEHYATVFEILSNKFKNRFSAGYLLLHWGLGLIIDKKYEDGRKKLMEAASLKDADPVHQHQALYYIGWSYLTESDNDKATGYWRKSQELAKAEKIDDADWLTYPYATFQLPPVSPVYEFSQEEFDEQMHEAGFLVEDKKYAAALDILAKAEKLLTDAQCSEIRLWAYVWDHRRYALYEAGKKDDSLTLCRHIIAEISKITLWDYLEYFNPVRSALRSAHNSLAYYCYETATDLQTLKTGISHIATTMKTIAPIEDKAVLNPYYETQALLFYKAAGFDPAYQKDLDKVVVKIKKLKLLENGILTDELKEKVNL